MALSDHIISAADWSDQHCALKSWGAESTDDLLFQWPEGQVLLGQGGKAEALDSCSAGKIA